MFRSEEMLDFHVQIPFAMNGKQKDSCIEVGNSYDNVFQGVRDILKRLCETCHEPRTENRKNVTTKPENYKGK